MMRISSMLGIVALALLAGCGGRKTPVSQIVNAQATFPTPGLPANPLQWRPVTSLVNRGDHTMSTLYGNDAAVDAARSHRPYGNGAVLSLVTWSEREDPHWYGGSIPGSPITIEFVSMYESTPQYRRFEGQPPHENFVTGETAQPRTAWILAQHAAPLP